MEILLFLVLLFLLYRFLHHSDDDTTVKYVTLDSNSPRWFVRIEAVDDHGHISYIAYDSSNQFMKKDSSKQQILKYLLSLNSNMVIHVAPGGKILFIVDNDLYRAQGHQLWPTKIE